MNCKFTPAIVIIALLFFAACASTGRTANASITGLSSLDEALDAAIANFEAKLPSGSAVVVTVISAPEKDTGQFISDELAGRFSSFVTLARDAALQEIEAEHMFQMTGLVSDESAVGIGHYIGAQIVMSGEMKFYADFTQLRLRAVDVKTSQAIIYTARIPVNDRLLANIIPSTGTVTPRILTTALDHLNRGKDFFVGGKWNEAIAEFDRAIAIDKNLAEAYFYRGFALDEKFDGSDKRDFDRMIADYTSSIRLNFNNPGVFHMRARAYHMSYFLYGNADGFDLAIADYTEAIRLYSNNPDPNAFNNRGNVYHEKGDFNRAIADFTQAIQLNPDHVNAFYRRGLVYAESGDLDRAIADWESVLRIEPNNANARANLEKARQMQRR